MKRGTIILLVDFEYVPNPDNPHYRMVFNQKNYNRLLANTHALTLIMRCNTANRAAAPQ